MEPTTRASLLWGVVGVLSFLVAAQTYYLLGGALVSPGLIAAIALCVGAVTTVLARLLRPRLIRMRSRG